MISKQELLQLRTEWQLNIGVIEKDYVLGCARRLDARSGGERCVFTARRIIPCS